MRRFLLRGEVTAASGHVPINDANSDVIPYQNITSDGSQAGHNYNLRCRRVPRQRERIHL